MVLLPSHSIQSHCVGISYDEASRFSKVANELQGGHVAKVDSNKVIYIPPGWLHATFTTRTGALVRINIDSLRCLPVLVQVLKASWRFVSRIEGSIMDDILMYERVALTFLHQERAPDILERVVITWVDLVRSLPAGFGRLDDSEGRVEKRLKQLMKEVVGNLMGKQAICCHVEQMDVGVCTCESCALFIPDGLS